MIRLAVVLCCLALPAAAVDCRDTTFEGVSMTLCEVDPAADRLQLFLYDGEGQPFGHFGTLAEALAQEIPFAMNAGMYHADRAPVGHYVEDGEEVMRVITTDGPGNFGLLPNGILCLSGGAARVYETARYVTEAPACHSATQSGPMLVIDGALHPRFLPASDSLYIRNGVGTTENGDRAVFVISNDPVNFHTFGRFFRDVLELPQALYFDGNISRLHAPQLERSDFGRPMGPIIAVTD
ncbi:phosphodiester glycosidase family protein [Aestuariibius sp. 2305UL40-4]|uniref:phosphodiester glycosidase family protein n=1 Tax=Aestuariibius violaceus TaxID=3234132 RepID=UPI00345EF5AA